MLGKLGGSVLLLVLAGGWAWQRDRRRRCLLRREAAWIGLLSRVREEISAFSAPFSRIVAGMNSDRLAETGETPGALSEDFAAACERSAAALPGEFGKTLGELAGEIGKTWRTEELAREDVWLSRLRTAYRTEKERAAQAARLETVLSLCAALGLSLILW